MLEKPAGFDLKATAGGKPVDFRFYEGSSAMTAATRARVDAPTGGPVAITLPRVTFKDFHDKAPLEMEGTIVAKDCGVIEAPDIGAEKGKPRPQADLSLTIEGEKIDVLAANLDGDKLVLSNKPLSCQESFSYADVTMLLRTDGKSAGVQGARVNSISLSDVDPPIKVEMGDPTADPVEVKIEGAFRHDIWAGEIKGKVSAVRCKK